MSNKQLPADVQEQKFVKALDVKDFDHQLWPGDIIKIYGKETSITGFSAQFNDALGKWETIIHTVGRGDPFERTLSDIEVLEEQPRSYEQRAALMLQPQHPGAVWVKASERLPEQKSEVVFRKKGVSRTAKPFYVNEYLFNLIVEGVLLIEYYIGCPLSEIEWLDEAAAEREDAVEFAEWVREQNYKPYAGSWYLNVNNYAHQPHSTAQLYELFKQNEK